MKRHQRLIYAVGATLLSAVLAACNSETDQKGPVNVDPELVEYLNEPYIPFEPEFGAAVPQTSESPLIRASLPYPPFNPHDLKTIGPEGWDDREQVYDANVGGVIFNLIWSKWQPTPNLDPATPNSFEHDGKIWLISKSREKQIRWYSERGIKVTAILYGTPEWARPVNTSRVGNVPLIDEKFIAPDDPNGFASFAGMLAKRFNGANGNGRIVNFVIQNEVNALDWYNPGCGAEGAPCSIPDRINSYATIYNLAYDKIVAEQPEARVMYSFDHHFGPEFINNQRFTSAKHFIEELEPKVGDRKWRLAFHSYPPDLFNPNFGPYDLPKVTFGNLGVLAAYLRQRYPTKQHTWDIHLTENGINSGPPSSQALMAQQLRVATRNVIGTPGIETFYYHRLEDHYQEGNFTPGLFDADGNSKQAWNTWSTNNLYNHNPPRLDDGYELLPYVKLARSRHPQKAHWASTREAPDGYVEEASFLLLREPAENTTLLFECHVDAIQGTYISNNLNCDGNTNFGPVGYIFNDQGQNRQALYSIRLGGGGNYLLSNNPSEGSGQATLLGYADTATFRAQALPARDLSFFSTEENGTVQNPPTAQGTPDVEIKTENWGACTSDDGKACGFLQFANSSGQTHQLNCRTEVLGNTSISLSYGNNDTSTVENLDIGGISSNATQNINLPIPDNATWSSVVLHTEGDKIPSCVMFSRGGLPFSPALGENADGLLHNGGFESSITDWEFCTTESVTDDAQQGAQAALISDGNCVFQEVEIEAGASYDMTCQALNNNGETTLTFNIANSSYQTLVESTQPVVSSDYGEFTATLTAPEAGYYAVVSLTSNGSAQLDNCSITEAGN
jgi:hypothetical protein